MNESPKEIDTQNGLKKPGKFWDADMTTLINKRTLLAMIPLSEKAIYNMEQRGEFPRRIALTSRNVAWDLADVEAWIADKKAHGQPAKKPGKQSPQPVGKATEILASQPAKVVELRR